MGDNAGGDTCHPPAPATAPLTTSAPLPTPEPTPSSKSPGDFHADDRTTRRAASVEAVVLDGDHDISMPTQPAPPVFASSEIRAAGPSRLDKHLPRESARSTHPPGADGRPTLWDLLKASGYWSSLLDKDITLRKRSRNLKITDYYKPEKRTAERLHKVRLQRGDTDETRRSPPQAGLPSPTSDASRPFQRPASPCASRAASPTPPPWERPTLPPLPPSSFLNISRLCEAIYTRLALILAALLQYQPVTAYRDLDLAHVARLTLHQLRRGPYDDEAQQAEWEFSSNANDDDEEEKAIAELSCRKMTTIWRLEQDLDAAAAEDDKDDGMEGEAAASPADLEDTSGPIRATIEDVLDLLEGCLQFGARSGLTMP